MQITLVKDIMMENPIFADRDDTIEDAAVEMKTFNCGVLPVGNKSHVSGIITDRDIIIRAIAAGKDPATEKVKNYMTAKTLFCNERDTVIEAAEIMKENAISHLIVKNDAGKVSGILSLDSILRANANTLIIADVLAIASSRKRNAA